MNYKKEIMVYGLDMGNELIRRGFMPLKVKNRRLNPTDKIFYFQNSKEIRYVIRVLNACFKNREGLA